MSVWPCREPKTALDLVFSTIEYRPAIAPTRALRDVRARRRGLMPLPTVAERLDQGAPRFIRRLNFDRGTRCCCLRLIERTDFASLTAISAARVPLSVPVSSWSWLPHDHVDAEPSRLDGPRRSTIVVETAGVRRDACCECAIRLRQHVWRVERAARREASVSCLTAVLWL